MNNIRHVIVVVLENHSFDQMLGGLSSRISDIDGINPTAPYSNIGKDGIKIEQCPIRNAIIKNDPPHELVNGLAQLKDNNGGFISEYLKKFPDATEEDQQQVMGYYPDGSLYALHELAKHSLVFNRWFCSLPGPTWQNRFFLLSGTSKGYAIMPEGLIDPNWHLYNQRTIFDCLNEKNISWRVCCGDFPQSITLVRQLLPRNLKNYRSLSKFLNVYVKRDEKDIPNFIFVEPKYFKNSNDDHPPHDTYNTQELIAQIYNAVRQNEGLWNSCALLFTYDENGGFYDHVAPPSTIPPDKDSHDYSFDTLGCRVPTLLVSPRVPQGVTNEIFDHTSLSASLAELWGIDRLGDRAAKANSFSKFANLKIPRTDFPEKLEIRRPLSAPEDPPKDSDSYTMNSHQKALIRFSAEYLEPKLKKPMARRVSAQPKDTYGEMKAESEAIQQTFEQFKREN